MPNKKIIFKRFVKFGSTKTLIRWHFMKLQLIYHKKIWILTYIRNLKIKQKNSTEVSKLAANQATSAIKITKN